MSRPTKPYVLRPAAGQALLSYQNRLQAVEMPLYEADPMEQVRDGKNTDPGNYLLQSDCLSACAWLKAQNMAVDLVYIDPPFASGADYAKKIWLRGKGKKGINGDHSLGEEVMYGDIWKKEDYLNWLYERLLAIREVMSETAGIYVHLDWHIGHYAKILMDEVFGEENFRNDLVWSYGGRGGKAQSGQFPRNHDMILLYSKRDTSLYNRVYRELCVPVQDAKKEGLLQDDQGRWFHHAPRGHYTDESVQKLEQEGRIYRNSNGTIRIKYFHRADDKFIYIKKLVGDVWDDIADAMHTPIGERTDYPTQKPEALLERIIKASSDEGMLVADFFSGSGTTAKVAHDLGRRFVVGDFGQNALQTSRDRLVKAGAHFDVLKVRDGVRLFRNPAQTEEKIFSRLDGWRPATLSAAKSDTKSDKGDGENNDGLNQFWEGSYSEDNLRVPVKYVGLDKKLTMELIAAVLEEAGQADVGKVMVLYAHRADNVTQEAVNREAKRHRHSDCRIVIRSLDDLLESKSGQITGQDSVELTTRRQKEQWRVCIRKYYSPYLTDKVQEHNERVGLDSDKRITLSEQGLESIECLQFGKMNKKGVWKAAEKLEFHASGTEAVASEFTVPGTVSHLKIRNIAGDEIIIDLADEAQASK